ncbi:hypothetical protein, partial [Paenibacillus odorifer]|uniref:hypothetical protein n=1 Tax=Paenibacillus odorifer TaxID=189426 RepID=UPI001C4CB2FE
MGYNLLRRLGYECSLCPCVLRTDGTRFTALRPPAASAAGTGSPSFPLFASQIRGPLVSLKEVHGAAH